MVWLVRVLIGTLSVVGVIQVLRRRRQPHYPSPLSLVVEPIVPLSATRQANGSVHIQPITMPENMTVYSGSHPSTIDQSHPIAHHVESETIIMPSAPTTTPYYMIADRDHTQIVGERVLPLQGAVNFRDIGGYRTEDGQHTRWGQVFRTGSLSGLTTSDWDYLQSIDVKIVCDLRSNEELAAEPEHLPSDAIQYIHLPLFTEENSFQRLRTLVFQPGRIASMLPETYTKVMIDQNPQVFRGVLSRLADPDNLPAIYHCTAGKDRTGVTTALLLSVLGVPDDTIIADYTLSNRDYAYFFSYASRALKPVAWLGLNAEMLHPLLVADAQTIITTLTHVRTTYGTVENYLISRAGLTHDQLTNLRTHLLQPAR